MFVLLHRPFAPNYKKNPNSFIFISGAKKSNKGVQFKINSVGINAQAIMKAEEDMKPLADVMPDEKDQRKK